MISFPIWRGIIKPSILRKRNDNLIQLYAGEEAYLKQLGLGQYILGKTCHGKKFAQEEKNVLTALRKLRQAKQQKV